MIRCCVPFCSKRRGDRKGDPVKQYAEWICGKHWDLLPKKQRRLFKRTQRRARDTGKRRDINKANWLWMVLKTRVMRRAL